MIKISVITPSFNQACFIERTIKSVLSQNIPDLEYLVVDGASTDETLNILNRYNAKLRWISEPDKGQADAVNKGLQQTSGEIIGWLNSDDMYYPNAVQKVHDFFEAHSEIDIIYGNAYYIDAYDNPIKKYNIEPWNLEQLKTQCYICQPAVFFRRKIVKQFGMLNENLHYCMDYEYWMRLALAGVHFTHIPQTLAVARVHPNCKTLKNRIELRHEVNDMLKDHLGKVPDDWLYNYAYDKLEHYNSLKKFPKLFTLLRRILFVYASIKWNKQINKNILNKASLRHLIKYILFK